MGRNILKEKSYLFALMVIKAYKGIIVNHKEYVLSKQLLKAGTAIGALIREAEYGQSKSDFVSKMSIGLKEANETEYWINLLRDSNYLDSSESEQLITANQELMRLLISSIKTAKNNEQ